MPSHADLVLRLLVALLLGGAIGLERELTGQAAGLRTHMSVALGAALFGILSAYGFADLIRVRNDVNFQMDLTRIASNVVVGIGFLGGGAIIKNGATVRGLTTAGSLWVTAAVGLAVALGNWQEAVFATAVLLFALTVLRAPRRWLRRFATAKETVIIHLCRDADAGDVVRALQHVPGVELRSLTLRQTNGSTVIQADVKGSELEARLAGLARRDDIVDVDIGV
jgi:putative Mg2+ transporter-C (MgtC) family protein